jgi:ArsR family transcriptional regulator, arsenate/arsenite/antimonite-responsive transcriptional repressor
MRRIPDESTSLIKTLQRFGLDDIIQRMLNYIFESEELALPPVNIQLLIERLKALAEPKRLLLFDLIMQGVQCNCELGASLRMSPNLISHHLNVLRQAGLVNVERDASDGRWVYYSINTGALEELNASFGAFFDPQRIQPRRLTCGPQGEFIHLDNIP